MFKVMFVLNEKAGMDRGEALRYWREDHGPLVIKVPGVRKYAQSHALDAPDGAPPFLGIAELWFDDENTFSEAAATKEFETALADVANFADTTVPTAFMDHVEFDV